MASPFYIFRKHQKAFLAVAAVLAMVIFVFADLFTSAVFSSRGQNKRLGMTVASWDGGAMTGREMETLTQRRIQISTFLARLQQAGAERLRDNGGTPMNPNVPNLILAQNLNRFQVHGGCINTRILSQLAKQKGISISDEQINDYLKELSFGQLRGDEIINLLSRGSQANQKQRVEQLFSGLRELLLGNTYLTSYHSALECVTPEQRWQDWRRVNERISLDATILPAQQFVSKVPEPTEVELRQLYDEYKNQVGDLQQWVSGRPLPSPNPGFMVPRRVKLQYLLGDIEAKSQELLDSVTEAEIAEFYESRKAQMFVKEESPSDTATTAATTTEAATTEAATTEAASKDDPKNDAKDENDAKEDSESGNSESGNSESGNRESGNVSRPNPFRLVLLQAEETAPEEISAIESSEKSSVTDKLDTDELETDELETDELETSADDNSEDKKEVEYEPLDNVRELIKRRVASQKAAEELLTSVEKAADQLQQEYRYYAPDLADAEEQNTELPKLPENLADLAALAKSTGLIHEKTVFRSRAQLFETFVGKAAKSSIDSADDEPQPEEIVARAMFDGSCSLHEPFLAKDLAGNWYLVVKTEEEPERVPPLEEIRDDVVDAWKLRKGAQLALAEAEQLAKGAKASGESLDIFLAGKPYETETTDLFSWLDFGTTPLEYLQYNPRRPQISDAPPLESVGPKFMEKAFDLQPQQVATVLNHDQSSAYIIRVAKHEKPEEELRRQFLAETNSSVAGYIMSQMRFEEARQGLISQLMSQANLNIDQLQEYLRPPEEDK